MAVEKWYTIRVRAGFAPIVAWKLHKLSLDVRVPSLIIDPREPQKTAVALNCYVQCRLDFENRREIVTIPGIVDILGESDSADTKAVLNI